LQSVVWGMFEQLCPHLVDERHIYHYLAGLLSLLAPLSPACPSYPILKIIAREKDWKIRPLRRACELPDCSGRFSN
jgi:hypothetical protein